jgi:TrmH family RNA methyltransferase
VITSPDNDALRRVRKLAGRRWRDKTREFVAEGEDLIAAAEAAGWPPALLLREGVEVAPHLLKQVSQLGSGTRALAVYGQRWAPAPAGPLCVALWGVGDPGNVGTVLRAALAFGASSVVLGPGTADPYGPKAVRASMGALFAVPVARAGAVEDLPGRTVALVARAGRPLWDVHEEEVSLVVGAEREGLPAEVVAACDEVAHIPIRSESLNAAMAATVGLYEATRPTADAAPAGSAEPSTRVARP